MQGTSVHFPLIQRVDPGIDVISTEHLDLTWMKVALALCTSPDTEFRTFHYFYTDATITKWRSGKLQLSSIDRLIIQRSLNRYTNDTAYTI